MTEGVIIADADLAEHSMIDLRALGVHMVLDDFGTGYSSLIYLRRFAFDKIKIDRSFLESMEVSGESAIIVRSIVDLGRSLGLRVTAEGIETEEQARILRSIDCDELQGFLFARPCRSRTSTSALRTRTRASFCRSPRARWLKLSECGIRSRTCESRPA